MPPLTTFLAIVFGLTKVANAAKTVPLTPVPDVPAARCRVGFKTGKNGNHHVRVKAGHLASPKNLTPAKRSYVVWFQERNGYPNIQGVPVVDM